MYVGKGGFRVTGEGVWRQGRVWDNWGGCMEKGKGVEKEGEGVERQVEV